MKLQVSKCCASPLLSRGSDEGTGWMACSLCKKPTDAMSYPFATVAQMETWLKKRKAYRGVAYTAKPERDASWNTGNIMEYVRFPSRSVVAFLVGCVIGVALFFALTARAESGADASWWNAGLGVAVRSFRDESDGLICWIADKGDYHGAVSISCQPVSKR